MTCAVCRACRPDPRNPARCLYGGPYSGFIPADRFYELWRDLTVVDGRLPSSLYWTEGA